MEIVKSGILIIVIIFGVYTLSMCQDTDSSVFIEGQYASFEKDKLGNFYLIDSIGQLYKHNSNGEFLDSNNASRFGAIKQLDVSNPQKILLYYHEFQSVIILDNTLSLIADYSLEDFGFWNTELVALSNDNQFWLFDQNEKKLFKIDGEGQSLIESNTVISESLCNYPMSQMLESGKKIYLNANGNGIIIFDNLGLYLKSIAELKTDNFQIFHSAIIYLTGNNQINIYRNAIEGPQKLYISKGNQKIIDFHIEKDLIYVLFEQGLFKIGLQNEKD